MIIQEVSKISSQPVKGDPNLETFTLTVDNLARQDSSADGGLVETRVMLRGTAKMELLQPTAAIAVLAILGGCAAQVKPASVEEQQARFRDWVLCGYKTYTDLNAQADKHADSPRPSLIASVTARCERERQTVIDTVERGQTPVDAAGARRDVERYMSNPTPFILATVAVASLASHSNK